MYENELINNYTEEKEITYKGECYTVRDNGAILRHALIPSKPRKLDENWTFGKKDNKTGYMMYGGHRVHIIVANAFHGVKDSKQYVVDHIDTNRCNNRVENLRWFTKLENALNNPVTLKKITLLCGGDIRKFLENPSCLQDLTGTYQDVMWMRTVTKEEAQNAYKHIMHWAKKTSSNQSSGIHVGEWVYKPFKEGQNIKDNKRASGTKVSDYLKSTNNEYYTHNNLDTYNKPESSDIDNEDVFEYLTKSLTTNVLQRNWNTPTEFPLCPQEVTEDGLENYFMNLKKGKKFCSNIYWESSVFDFAISDVSDKIWVVCQNDEKSTKKWALAEITIEKGCYVHTTIGTYFEQNGVMQEFTLIQGKEWEGEDSIDNYL